MVGVSEWWVGVREGVNDKVFLYFILFFRLGERFLRFLFLILISYSYFLFSRKKHKSEFFFYVGLVVNRTVHFTPYTSLKI